MPACTACPRQSRLARRGTCPSVPSATRRWRMRSRGGNCSALAKGGLERGTPNVSVRELLDLEHDLAVIGALQHETVGVAGLLYRQGVSDFGMQFALFNPRLHGLQTAANQIVVLGQGAEPPAVRGQTFRSLSAGCVRFRDAVCPVQSTVAWLANCGQSDRGPWPGR